MRNAGELMCALPAPQCRHDQAQDQAKDCAGRGRCDGDYEKPAPLRFSDEQVVNVQDKTTQAYCPQLQRCHTRRASYSLVAASAPHTAASTARPPAKTPVKTPMRLPRRVAANGLSAMTAPSSINLTIYGGMSRKTASVQTGDQRIGPVPNAGGKRRQLSATRRRGVCRRDARHSSASPYYPETRPQAGRATAPTPSLRFTASQQPSSPLASSMDSLSPLTSTI